MKPAHLLPPFGTFFALALAVASLSGCAAADGADAAPASSDEQNIESDNEPAVDVTAAFHRAFVGTPTYGYSPTAPFLTIRITVEDDLVAKTHPGFDGLEKPFVLLPHAGDGGDGKGVRWERVDLAYEGASTRGYIDLHRLDVYALASVRLTEDDLALAQSEGFAVGLDTNVGTVWARDEGKNFLVPATPAP